MNTINNWYFLKIFIHNLFFFLSYTELNLKPQDHAHKRLVTTAVYNFKYVLL